MSHTYIIRTENETVYTNALEIQRNYCWIQELQTLYRLMESDSDLQPDAIVFKNEIKLHNLRRIGRFKNSKEAFACIDSNTTRASEALKELDEILDTGIGRTTVPEILESPKTYLGCYMFNYFGGDTIEDKVIDGAGIYVAFRPYKDGKLIQFRSEKETYFNVTLSSRLLSTGRKENIYLTDAVIVSYDRENCYKINIDPELVKIICDHFGWDNLCIEVERVCLYYTTGKYISEEYQCGKDVFERFLKAHPDDFDITDNKNAQCPAYGWAEK